MARRSTLCTEPALAQSWNTRCGTGWLRPSSVLKKLWRRDCEQESSEAHPDRPEANDRLCHTGLGDRCEPTPPYLSLSALISRHSFSQHDVLGLSTRFLVTRLGQSSFSPSSVSATCRNVPLEADGFGLPSEIAVGEWTSVSHEPSPSASVRLRLQSHAGNGLRVPPSMAQSTQEATNGFQKSLPCPPST